AEQGDRGRQRVPPRVRHPPGWRAEAPRDLRGDRPRRDRASDGQRDRARQAVGPTWLRVAGAGARHRVRRRGAGPRVRALPGAGRPARRSERPRDPRDLRRERRRGEPRLSPAARSANFPVVAGNGARSTLARSGRAVLRNARVSALLVAAASEALTFEWAARAFFGTSLGPGGFAVATAAIALGNALALANLTRIARAPAGYRLGRLFLVGSV